MKSHYDLTRAELIERCPFPLQIVPDHATLNQQVAQRMADLIETNNAAARESTFILPVGPVLYEPLAHLLNERRTSMDRVIFYMMDEYLTPEGTEALAADHPLSFRGFMRRGFLANLDPARGFSEDKIIFPVPANLDDYSRAIMGRGGVDLCVAGVGISGHLAFNDPPEPDETDKDTAWVRTCPTRLVHINRESCTQMAVGGTHGNWDIIPRLACTVGMKEILASKKILLCGMRTWHAGTVRRALFGPVSADCPGSLLQEHPKVDVLLTELAARPPLVNVTLDTGEEVHE
jgi:glucosamine-6-phosphate deaminase